MPNAPKRRTRRRGKAAELPAALPCATAASIAEEEVSWLWEGRVPFKRVTLLAGPGEVGKSTVATVLAAAVSCGRAMPGGPELERPRSVLWYCSEEVPCEDVRPRLRVNGGVLARCFFPEVTVAGTPARRPHLPRDMGIIAELAKQVDAGLIVFDPITSYCEDGANPDHGSTARPVIEALKEIAQAANCAVLPIKHPKKFVPGGGPLDQISGSKEWTNIPRSVLLCAPHPDDETLRCLCAMKASKCERRAETLTYRIIKLDGLPVLRWGGPVDLAAAELLDASGSPAERDTLADAKSILIDRLREGEQKSRELLQWLQDAGVPVSCARKAKKLLGITSHTIGPIEARFHVWRPPAGGFRPEGA